MRKFFVTFSKAFLTFLKSLFGIFRESDFSQVF